jgi:hypothetical protein
LTAPEADQLCHFQGETMLKRQWTVPVLTLAFVVVGLMVATGCNKTSTPGGVSSVTAPSSSTEPMGPGSFSKSAHSTSSSVIPVSGPNCGFDPANFVEDDLTELVATAIKKGVQTSIAGTTIGRVNHYRYSHYLGDPYGANAPDITYQFTLTQDQLPNTVYFYTCDNSGTYGSATFNHMLRLFQGNCSNYESMAGYSNCGSGGCYVGGYFTQPGTYYVVLDGYYYAYDQGKFVLNICSVC